MDFSLGALPASRVARAERGCMPREGLVCLDTSLPLPRPQGRAMKSHQSLTARLGTRASGARPPVDETFQALQGSEGQGVCRE